ncbi:phospholipase D family protein [Aeromonas sp. s3]|uniref:phospholipase D family protein n=1 Tax=Aeromonas sp. s3 TaxID=3138485 RepID=UPI0034A3BC1C
MLLSNENNLQVEHLKDIIKSCDERVVIISPYLAEDMKSFLNNFDFSSVKKVELITTFKPKDLEQITKPFQLKDFYHFFHARYPKINVKVHVDNNLHGKLYFSLGKTRKLILTSGNFTSNGLFHNHEWGILITDNDLIEEALNQAFDLIDFPDVTNFQIERACLFADVYLKITHNGKKKKQFLMTY